jgi:hypothetical protein
MSELSDMDIVFWVLTIAVLGFAVLVDVARMR